MRRFDLLVFDWDGTLMDSAQAIAAALQSACAELGMPVPEEERARFVIGLGLNDAMAQLLDYGPVVCVDDIEGLRHWLSRHA